ncbi:MAG: thioesterase family protein [Acidimicrobiia bacterium]|nr:thioesterase family protein [Acidimicrobiia bacterium]
MCEPTACFEPDGELFVPTPLANGPWAVGVLHGGPTGALLAHLCETCSGASPGSLRVARITVDLLRPVPLAPLRAEVRLARPGRKVDWVDASLFAGEVEVARASALRLRGEPLALPPEVDPWSRGAPGDQAFNGSPEDGQTYARPGDDVVPGFHDRGVDLRFVRGLPNVSGPGQVWGRLRHPVIAGTPTSPLMRVMGCADFGNAASSLMPPDAVSFINADLLVSLWRQPEGEWIGIDAVTRADPDRGTGLAEMALHDRLGPVGRAEQNLFLQAVRP